MGDFVLPGCIHSCHVIYATIGYTFCQAMKSRPPEPGDASTAVIVCNIIVFVPVNNLQICAKPHRAHRPGAQAILSNLLKTYR